MMLERGSCRCMASLCLVVLLGMAAAAVNIEPVALEADVTGIDAMEGKDMVELGEGEAGPAPLDPFQALGSNATKNASKIQDRGQNPFPAPANGIKVDYDKRSGSDGTKKNGTANATAWRESLGEGAGSGAGSGTFKKYESLFMANGTMKAQPAEDIAKAAEILKGIKGDGSGSGVPPAEIAASIESVASTIVSFSHANQEPKDSPHPGAPVNPAVGSGTGSGKGSGRL